MSESEDEENTRRERTARVGTSIWGIMTTRTAGERGNGDEPSMRSARMNLSSRTLASKNRGG